MKSRKMLILFAFVAVAALIVTFCYFYFSGKTVDSAVFVHEFDETAYVVDEQMVTDFCETLKNRYEVKCTNIEESETTSLGIVFLASVHSKDNHEYGVCYGYSTEEQAKAAFSMVFDAMGTDSMNRIFVRIGRFVFSDGCRIWPALFQKIGIDCQTKEIEVYSAKKVKTVPYAICDKESLLKGFTENGFYTVEADGFWELRSTDGAESYTVCYDEKTISDLRNGELLLFELLNDNASAETSLEETTRGMTIYDGGNCIVISRGKTFEERYSKTIRR